MPFRFRKIFKIAPGFRVNLSKRGLSTSIGKAGATLNIGKRGIRPTVGLPGTGLSFTPSQASSTTKKASGGILFNSLMLIVSLIFLCIIIICCIGLLFTNSEGGTSTPTPEAQIPIQQIIVMTSNAAQQQTMVAGSPVPFATTTPAPLIEIPSTATIFIFNLQTDVARPTAFAYSTNTPFILATAPPSSGGGNNNNFDSNGDGKVTCADFQTQAAAQQAYNAGYIKLDGNDKDGKACESLP